MSCILRFVFICILRFVFICILGFVSYPLRRYPPSFGESDGHLEICKNGCFILFASNMFLFHSHSPKVTTARTLSHGVSFTKDQFCLFILHCLFILFCLLILHTFPFSPNMTITRTCVPFDKKIVFFVYLLSLFASLLSIVCLSCITFPFSPNVTAPRTCVSFDKMIALFIFHSLWSALLHPRLSPIIPLIWVQPRLILLILPSKYFGTTTLPFPFFLESISIQYGLFIWPLFTLQLMVVDMCSSQFHIL